MLQPPQGCLGTARQMVALTFSDCQQFLFEEAEPLIHLIHEMSACDWYSTRLRTYPILQFFVSTLGAISRGRAAFCDFNMLRPKAIIKWKRSHHRRTCTLVSVEGLCLGVHGL